MEQNEFKDKVILITGGTGAIGSELVRQLLTFEPKQIRVFSRDESKQYQLLEDLDYPKNIRLIIGDIRDEARLELAFRNVDIVFHAAALKHVPLCEYNPFEAVQTNIIGSKNVIDAALANGVKKVIAVSTDKAVHPNNIMGTTKLMMEKLFTNVNYFMAGSESRFACVRFGNVAWTRGSVLPLWQAQIKRNGGLKITDPQMTRFLMSKEQAIGLILKAAHVSRGGEIFIFKMPSITLPDLASLFLQKYHTDEKITTTVVGPRPGEKTHEELFDSGDQAKMIFENDEMFVIIPPAIEIYGAPDLHYEETYQQQFRRVENHGLTSYCSKDHLDPKLIQEIV
ncbi:MAG: hypothetical protein A3J59_02315 [Candidatus Buchananbacteria bacterium RIFCSPHIGHO2_02_FULL_56_16]|uniref:Polysaccharide biosynthesis protein CapD-like domain-containing protein n=1 Tax=Candidatus Buchananbacteria bacterium RIFCSPHIGHO2_02_FULL_56_16 TaxID=1797542 RepID=A0A1G1YG23_9BACT|nr:MAG: hypothetical protein A3J59_02315 [Candidatus Buchananbacteria bacterium RIFCSPHIGHO2_02_FULL_56_16]